MNRVRGAVAAGHPLTAKIAEAILKDGGNAFDAVLGAQLTALVVEPVLTSLGGGGFLFAEQKNGKQCVYDFFVQTPLNKSDSSSLDFFPIDADFGEAKQEYRIGAGSVAVPGMIKGLYKIHTELCSLPIKTLAQYAIEHARKGVKMNAFQSGIFDVVKPIYESSDAASEIFRSRAKEGELIREDELLKQPELADALELFVKEGDRPFYEGHIADAAVSVTMKPMGHLAKEDFESYSVKLREPLNVSFRGHSISLNPPPGSGGLLIAFALKLIESTEAKIHAFGSRGHITKLAEIQRMTDGARVESLSGKTGGFELDMLDESYLEMYRQKVSERLKGFRGTTQISIIDGHGNKASLTSSNGEGSGVLIPGTGIMLNNMLGEQDLNPNGFHKWKTNQRVSSMMSPGILKMESGKSVVFGSGGSNRIRTAILQLLINLVDYGMPLDEAVNAPRLHFESGKLNAENGFDLDVFRGLGEIYPDQKIWKNKSLYFGGAHAVSIENGNYSGAGDSRRGGASIVL